MARERFLRTEKSFLKAYACANAAGKIRKADAEIAFGVLIDQRWIVDFLHFAVPFSAALNQLKTTSLLDALNRLNGQVAFWMWNRQRALAYRSALRPQSLPASDNKKRKRAYLRGPLVQVDKKDRSFPS